MTKKSDKKMFIIVGVAAAAAIYILTRTKSTPTYPYGTYAPGVTPVTAPTTTNPTNAILSAAGDWLSKLFSKDNNYDGSSLPGLATTVTPSSPTSGVTYINPSAPYIPITANSPVANTSWDWGDWDI